MSKVNSAIAVKVVELLEPISSDERQRIIKAALVLLGEESLSASSSSVDIDDASDEKFPLSPKGGVWAKHNKISFEQLAQVFHAEGDNFEIIVGEVSGRANKDKIRKAYLLMGLAEYLKTGNGSFEDKAARSLCEKFGCYDSTNHAKALKFGNELTGSVSRGWTITGPGLKQAASLVAELSSGND